MSQMKSNEDIKKKRHYIHSSSAIGQWSNVDTAVSDNLSSIMKGAIIYPEEIIYIPLEYLDQKDKNR